MSWWDIYVQVPESMSECVSEQLHRLGSSAVILHEPGCLVPQHTPCVDTSPQAAGWVVLQGALQESETFTRDLQALQQALGALPWRALGVRWQLYCCPLVDESYLTQWQHFFQPLLLGGRVLIRPSWDTTPVAPDLACLTLDPGLAFGTGTHATTRMCLDLLVQYASPAPQEPFLDMGCGSGILSLAALHLGWQTAVGVDIDAQAVAVARQNAQVNQLQERVRFLQGSWHVVQGPFSAIAANVYLGPLVEMLPALRRLLTPPGLLVLSGIVEHQEGVLRGALTDTGFTLRQRLATDGWVALAAQRTSR